MAAAEAREVFAVFREEIVSIVSVGIPATQLLFDSTFNDAGELVFNDFSLIGRSVSCFKLAITAYHATDTPRSKFLRYVAVGGCSVHFSVIALHLDKNNRLWIRIRILYTAIIVMAGMFLFDHGMIMVHTANICVLFLEAGLFVHSQIKKDGGTKKLLCDVLIISVNTIATSFRFVDSLEKTHGPWDAEKFLNLFGIGLSVLLGVGQIACIAFKLGINIRRVCAGEEGQATRAVMWGNGRHDAEGQVEDEGAEAGNSLPVTIGAPQVGSTVYIAGIMCHVGPVLLAPQGACPFLESL